MIAVATLLIVIALGVAIYAEQPASASSSWLSWIEAAA